MYVGRMEKLLSEYSPMPMCIVDARGKVVRVNGKIAEVFKYDGIEDRDIYALTGIKMADIMKAADSDGAFHYTKRNDKVFKIIVGSMGEGENKAFLLYFVDVTAYEECRTLYDEEKVCIAIVNVDNFDELTASAGEDHEMEISTEIDKVVRNWGAKLEATVARYRDHLYEVVFSNKNYKLLIRNKFSILDEAREIVPEADFPVTLSIGIGRGGKTIAETDEFAQEAIDIALGRGGDQAVVKNKGDFEYYGGKTQSVEKGYKGKSRIIAHALKTLMMQSGKIFIMGHKDPDMDCFGSSLGINRIAAALRKEAYIVMDSHNDALTRIMNDARETEEYEFITGDKALSIASSNDLVVILDTHRPSLVASMELVRKINRTVVIDHHRRAEDALPNQLLSYMEPYASSTAELVTEIVQYACDKKVLSNTEADALLAGIMVDTNRFAVKAGVRTFEAASWLKRAGADLDKVRLYFQSDAESFKMRAAGVANAKFYEDGIAMSICEGRYHNAQIINSQVADELLTIKGINASFVAGQNEKGGTVVSARSLGDVNVQLIMEGFGGGGHFNTAGAQVDVSPEEILTEIRKVLDRKILDFS